MDYTINNYRFKKFGDKYFVTTDHGSFCILSLKEFKSFRRNDFDQNLKEKLEKKELILNQENLNDSLRLMRCRNSFLFQGTSLHIIVVTLRCNMNCVYCHASSKPENEVIYDMNKDTAKKTVDFIFQTPNSSITIEFQGGEPLLNWDVVKFIIEYSKEKNKSLGKNLSMTIVTNLSRMDDEKMDFLLKNDVALCTSLDGPKWVHDFNRKFSIGSNYEDVVKWTKRFNEAYQKSNSDRRVNALVTLTSKSLDYPKEIVDEYVKRGFKDIHLRFLNNLGVAVDTWDVISYSVSDYLDFWRKSVEYIIELNKKGVDISERMVSIMTSKIANEIDPNYLDLRSPCGAAIGQLAYNYNGDIYTCDEARMLKDDDLFLLGNVCHDVYKEIVTSDKACAVINASINDQYICDSCVYKQYCGVCPVCNYAEQGNVVGKISQTDRCKIFKAQFDWVVNEKFIN